MSQTLYEGGEGELQFLLHVYQISLNRKILAYSFVLLSVNLFFFLSTRILLWGIRTTVDSRYLDLAYLE